MAILNEQAEQRKRKRQSDAVRMLVHRSLHRADGPIQLQCHPDFPQMNVSIGHKMLNHAETSMPVPHTSHRVANPTERNLSLVRQIRPRRLRDVSSFEEFKSVFNQVVHCHRAVFVNTGDLHGNLSPRNLMFARDNDGTPLGYLDDWDIARPVSASKTSHMAFMSHRTGTAPFLAIELLDKKPPPHLYRHDLESFLYILIWCVVHYKFNGSEEEVSPATSDWTEGSCKNIQRAKAMLFSSKECIDQIYREIRPAFLPIQRWIKGLVRMFRAGNWARITREDSLELDAEDEAAGDWDEDTLGGTVTYEKFMAAIGEKPQIAGLGDEDR